jgi:hypothetical protein
MFRYIASLLSLYLGLQLLIAQAVRLIHLL